MKSVNIMKHKQDIVIDMSWN